MQIEANFWRELLSRQVPVSCRGVGVKFVALVILGQVSRTFLVTTCVANIGILYMNTAAKSNRDSGIFWYKQKEFWIVFICNITLQYAATRCNTLQHTTETRRMFDTNKKSLEIFSPAMSHCNTLQRLQEFLIQIKRSLGIFSSAMPRCNTLQPTTTFCNSLQGRFDTNKTQTRNITVCNVTLQHSATQCKGAVKHFHLQCSTKQYLDTNKKKSWNIFMSDVKQRDGSLDMVVCIVIQKERCQTKRKCDTFLISHPMCKWAHGVATRDCREIVLFIGKETKGTSNSDLRNFVWSLGTLFCLKSLDKVVYTISQKEFWIHFHLWYHAATHCSTPRHTAAHCKEVGWHC